MRRVPPPDLAQLTDEITREAASDSGTLSYATYVKVKKRAAEMTWDDATRFIAVIIDHIVQPDVHQLMLFKLSQLCTVLHSMGFPAVTGAFQQFERQITAAYPRIEQAGKFGRPVVKLLMTLFPPKDRKASSPAAVPPSGGQGSHLADEESIRMVSLHTRSVSSLFV
jgi:hypothetical protein